MKCCEPCAIPFTDAANFCQNCGRSLRQLEPPEDRSVKQSGSFGWGWFAMSLLLSVGLTLLLTVVFQMPVFIFGLFLPFLWHFRPKARQ